MILHLRREGDRLSLWGESFGRRVSAQELCPSLRFLFVGWRDVVLEGRGVLQVLRGVARGQTSPLLVYDASVRTAAAALTVVLRLIAAGRVVPTLQENEARWRLTVLPEEYDPALANALADLWMRTCASTTLTRAQAAKAKFYTADDAWLAALRAPNAHVSPTSPELASALSNWAAPLFEGGRAALPLVPRHTEEGWYLDYGEAGASASTAVLRLLGQAIAVAPLLAMPQPWDKETFARFLREAVPALRAAAFVVTLPSALEASVPEVRETALSLDGEHVRVARTVCLAGTELSEAEAQAILDAGEPLAFIHGEWRYVDLEALRRALEALGPAEVSRHRALPLLMAGALRIAPDAQDVRDFLREMTSPPSGDLPLRTVLRPYQAQGVCWLMQAAAHGLGVCLADDMGLGKTLQTIAFLLSRPGPALVVAPLTVLPVWERELARWAPNLRVYRHDGPQRVLDAGFAKLAQEADVTLTAYGYLWRDYVSLRRVDWATLVLDEAQQIKNPGTRQSQAARSLGAEFRLALTGTPIENRLDDLWSLLDFLNPGLFGPRKDFATTYADPVRLRRAVSHFLLRRLKRDPGILAELPPKIVQEHYAPLTDLQAAAYDLALAEYARDARNRPSGERAGAVLVLLTRLKQICDGLIEPPSLADGQSHEETQPERTVPVSGKLLVLLPLLDDILAGGESVLVFTQFVTMGEWVKRVLEERLGRPVPFVHGGLTASQRKEAIGSFSEDPRPGVLILSLRTGAFGLTLTKANHVIHLDRWWNPAVEEQATDRVHRIGQRRTVVVHHLLCRGTLEDRIDRLLREKRDLAERIVAPTPAALLARLPSDTLMGLLRREGTTERPH